MEMTESGVWLEMQKLVLTQLKMRWYSPVGQFKISEASAV